MLDALAAALADGGVDRVVLDASACVTLDFGARVRAARFTPEDTGDRPCLPTPRTRSHAP